MTLGFHPDAADNFAEKGRRLRDKTEIGAPDSYGSAPSKFSIDPYVADRITEEEIEEINYWSRNDMAGDEHSRFYPAEDDVIALEGELFQQFRDLAVQMRRTNTLRRRVAVSTVTDALGRWLVGTKLGEINEEMPEYVLQECEKEIYDHEVLIPLFHVYLEEPLELGRVTLRPVTRSDFSHWQQLMKGEGGTEENIAIRMKRWRKRMQGQAAAEMRLSADAELAFQVAREEAQRAVEMLRIFSPAMFHPRIPSYCALRGREKLEQSFGIIVRDGNKLASRSGFVDPGDPKWQISRHDVAKYRDNGLEALDSLLRQESPSKFQSELLNALRIYSRAAIESDQTEKLLHIIVGVESLLLRDSSEPISTNISERMAFLIRQRAEDRRAVAKAVRDAYAPRSGYLHHGSRVEEVEELVEFMRYAWEFFMIAARNHDRFERKQQFIDAIETVKYQ